LFTNRTTIQKLDDKISSLLQNHSTLKEENEQLRLEIASLKAQSENKDQEIARLEHQNSQKDLEIDEIVKKIESVIA
jgi:predicted  nucleic acid-binding Zn-ribbon protein